MKGALRGVWVLAANGCLVWVMLTRLASVGFYRDSWDPELWFELLFEVFLPVVGIILKFVNWKFARWVNVGTFTVAGCFWLAGAIWWRSDPFFGVLLIIAVGLLIFGGLTEIIYRWTGNDPPSGVTGH